MSNRTLRTPQRARDGFLAALERGLSISGACRAAGLGRSTAYDLRASDDAFARAWDRAIDQGTDVLEDEAFRRACEGVEEPPVSGGRQMVGPEGKPIVVRRYSDSLMVTLLKARRPERFRERSTVEARVAVAQDPGPAIREVLATLSREERDVVRRICERQITDGRTGHEG